eukprot:TRINITY_DN80972_c0_g1_i1.p1 TRINITY_DN80972_c0_g1~~TRINITY_DN80972_c0_g1_i1.p1  ORF type:complete len:375 (+),score=35.37 TRINITY_DN80972_c0_g1_i1:61-1185(+)
MGTSRSSGSQGKGLCLICTGVLLLFVFILTANTLAAFTPLYTPIVCNATERHFDKETLDENWGVHVNGTAVTICENPNRHSFFMEPITHTKLYLALGDDVSSIGNATMSPQQFLAGGKVELLTDIAMHMNSTQIRGMLAYYREQGKPMMISVAHVWGRVEIDLYGWTLSSPWQERRSWCGWSVNPIDRLNGPVACENSLPALRGIIKPATATAQPFAVPCPPEKIAEAEQIRDWFCMSLMLMSFLLFVAVLIRFLFHYRQRCRSESISGKRAAEDDASKVENGLAQSSSSATAAGKEEADTDMQLPTLLRSRNGSEQANEDCIDVDALKAHIHTGHDAPTLVSTAVQQVSLPNGSPPPQPPSSRREETITYSCD